MTDGRTLAPLPHLLAAYAPRPAAAALVWMFDARLAQVVRSTGEPLIGQMKLTWWHDALLDDNGVKGRGEPLVDAMRMMGMAGAPGLIAMIDGWEGLMGDIDLDLFASGRGGGLFGALAGNDAPPDWLADAGRVWALWDFSGHAGDQRLAAQAIALARNSLIDEPRWPRAWKAMRIAYGLARHDVVRGRAAPDRLTPRLYARLLRLGLLGR